MEESQPSLTYETFSRGKEPRVLLKQLQSLATFWYINRSLRSFQIETNAAFHFFTGFYHDWPNTTESSIQYSIQFVSSMKHLVAQSQSLTSSLPTLYRPDFLHQLFQVIAYELQEMADEIPTGLPLSVVYRPIGLRHPTIVHSPFYHTYRMFNFLLSHGFMYRLSNTDRERNTQTSTPTTPLFSTEHQSENIKGLHRDITNEPHRFKGTVDFFEAFASFREETLCRGDPLLRESEYMISMRRIFCSILLTFVLDLLPLIQTHNLTFLDQHRSLFVRLMRLIKSERTAILMQGRKYMEYRQFVQIDELLAILTSRFYRLAPMNPILS